MKTEPSILVDTIMKQKYVVNEWIDVVMEDDGKTKIYIAGQEFVICKYVLLSVYPDIQGETIDEIIRNTPPENKILEGQDDFKIISSETAFFVHCSNIQAWVDNGYDPALIDARISFPVIKRLADLGVDKAKQIFQEILETRINSGNINALIAFQAAGFLNELPIERVEHCLKLVEDAIFKPLTEISNKSIPGRKKTIDLRDICECVELFDILNRRVKMKDWELFPVRIPDHLIVGNPDPATIHYDEKYGHIYLGLHSGTVLTIDWKRGRVVRFIIGHSEYLSSIALSEDRKYLATASPDGSFAVYDASARNQVFHKSIKHMDRPPVIAFSTSGHTLFYTDTCIMVHAVDIISGNDALNFLPRSITASQWRPCQDVQTSHDGKYAFLYNYFEPIMLAVDIETGKFLFESFLGGNDTYLNYDVKWNEQTGEREVTNYVFDQKTGVHQAKQSAFDPMFHVFHYQIISESRSFDERIRVFWRGDELIYENIKTKESAVIFETPIKRFFFGPSVDQKSILIWFILERDLFGIENEMMNGKIWTGSNSRMRVWDIPVLIYQWDITARKLVCINHDSKFTIKDTVASHQIVRSIDHHAFDELKIEPSYPNLYRVFGYNSISSLIINDDQSRIATICENTNSKNDGIEKSGIFIWDVATNNTTRVYLIEDLIERTSLFVDNKVEYFKHDFRGNQRKSSSSEEILLLRGGFFLEK